MLDICWQILRLTQRALTSHGGIALVSCLTFLVPAEAQIFKCHDPSGKVHYSDRNCNGAGAVLRVVPNVLGPRIPSVVDQQNGTNSSRPVERISRSGASGALQTLEPSTSRTAFACPPGLMPWIDKWGNKICQNTAGRTASIETNGGGCPIGTHSWVDRWGNPVCQQIDGSQQFHDTSKGCPIGTYSWPDTWGNPGCKSF